MRPKIAVPSAPSIKGAGHRWPLSAELRASCRRAVANGLYHTGLLHSLQPLERTHELHTIPGSRLPRLRRFSGSKFGILCYHRVGTEGVPLHSRLAPAAFEAQMRHLRKHYRIVPLGQLCCELQEDREVEPTLAITFDDGYRDLYTHAFPVLRKYEIPATIYLIGRSLETGEAPWYDRIFAALAAVTSPRLDVELNATQRLVLSNKASRAAAAWEIICYLRSIPDCERRKWCTTFEELIPIPAEKLEGRMLDWEQVRTMLRSGILFGAHTMTHPAVSRLTVCDFDNELEGSRRLLENGLQVPVLDFAYPFGKPADYSRAAVQFLAEKGFRSAATTREGINSSGADMFALRRTQVSDDPSLAMFSFAVTRMFLETATERVLTSAVSAHDDPLSAAGVQ
jgi:peptidoglycan/xylan/chitin deacetylase (PgdA/CDA1 family)